MRLLSSTGLELSGFCPALSLGRLWRRLGLEELASCVVQDFRDIRHLAMVDILTEASEILEGMADARLLPSTATRLLQRPWADRWRPALGT